MRRFYVKTKKNGTNFELQYCSTYAHDEYDIFSVMNQILIKKIQKILVTPNYGTSLNTDLDQAKSKSGI